MNATFLYISKLQKELNLSNDQEISILGPWCYENYFEKTISPQKHALEKMDSPWKDAKDRLAASQEIVKIYEIYLIKLADIMNIIHQVSYSTRFWRILLGPWLYRTVTLIYDKYHTVEHVISKKKLYWTSVLPEDALPIPLDIIDFFIQVKEELLHYYVYSLVIQQLNAKEITFKTVQQETNNEKVLTDTLTTNKKRLLGIGQKLRAFSFSLLKKAVAGKKISVVIFSTSLPKKTRIKMFLSLGVRLFEWQLLHYLGEKCSAIEPESTSSLREQFKKMLLPSTSPFDLSLCKLIGATLPLNLLECFKEYCQYLPVNPNIASIFSSNGWYHHSYFSNWAARQAEAGTKIHAVCHGALGPLIQNHFDPYLHDMRIADHYYPWWSEQQDSTKNLLIMPSPKILAPQQKWKPSRNNEVLFVTTSCTQHTESFPLSLDWFCDYLDSLEGFFNHLPPHLQHRLRWRPHREDLGWGFIDHFSKKYPKIKIEGWDQSFEKSIESCQVLLCDHLSTTYNIALYNNTPTILYLTHGDEINPKLKWVLDFLYEAEILHHNAKEALLTLENNLDNISAWWFHPKRQQLLAKYMRAFGGIQSGQNPHQMWVDEVKKISKKQHTSMGA